MLLPVRTLSAQDADVLGRSVETRTLVGGVVECHGLSWKTNALHDWENTERALGREPRVEVRIDELDFHVAYIDSPTGGGAIKLDSRQPEFTRGLSLFELNRLKKVVKDKALADRIGRMSDGEALRLRIEWYALLGHGDDPVAQRRLSDLQDQLAKLRLQRAGLPPSKEEHAPGLPPPETPSTPPKPGTTKRAGAKAAQKRPAPPPTPAPQPQAPPTPTDVPPPTPSPAPAPTERKPGDLPKPKFPSLNLKRSPV